MSQKILVAMSVALLLGVSNSALAQTQLPLPQTGGSTSTDAGASTSTDTSAGSSTSTDTGAGTSTDAGANAGTSTDAGANAGTSTDTGSSTDTGTQSGSSTDAGAGSDTGTDAGAGAGGTTTQSGSTATGNADANASTEISVDVTNEQQTEIHQAITQVNVEPVTSVDFDVSVGVTVPTTIELNPLPAQVIEIVPQFEGYLFFLLPDGRIVIVAPDTLTIVYILS